MPFQFKAVKYTSANSPLAIKTDKVDVTEKSDGTFEVASDKVFVKIKASALNPVDLVLKSMVPFFKASSEKGFSIDYSGEVVGIGKEAAEKTELKVGDKVCGMNHDPYGKGTLAEYVLVDPFVASGASIHKYPESLNLAEAAAYPLVLGTAIQFFDSVPEQNQKKRVLILGAGTSVGKYMVQLAKNVYNVPEISFTCSPSSQELIKKLGGNTWIDYTKQKSIAGPVKEIAKTHGKFDVIFDCAGNSDLFPVIEDVLVGRKDFGTYYTISGDYKYTFGGNSFLTILWHNLLVPVRALRSKFGLLDYIYAFIMLDPAGPWPKEAKQYIEEGKVSIKIDKEYDFADFEEAVRRIASNKANGKVVIHIN